MANRVATSLIVLSLAAAAVSADPAPPATTTDDAAAPQPPPSRWQLKEGAPPGVSLVLERMKRQRQREFDAQRRAIERAERDLAARKAGRVVKELKAPQGWRALPSRAGGDAVEFTFRTPQIKGQEVVKAENALEATKRRLADIAHPDYLAKPLLLDAELEEGSAGMISFRIAHQVSSTEAVVQFIDESASGGIPGRYVAGKDLFLSDFPARDHRPGMLVRDWTIEVVGIKTYQGDNGRKKSALHAKPVDWRKWVDLAKAPRPGQ